MLSRSIVGGVAAACVLGACGGGAPDDDQAAAPDMHLETAPVRIFTRRDTIRLVVELAVTDEQKRTGLMERRQLADTAGMLFVYDSVQPPDAGFWMYRTRIPLDIAYIDSSGRIRVIRQMVPCEARLPEGCPTYPPEVPYQYALEVSAGWFARRAVAVGDSVGLAEAVRRAR